MARASLESIPFDESTVESVTGVSLTDCAGVTALPCDESARARAPSIGVESRSPQITSGFAFTMAPSNDTAGQRGRKAPWNSMATATS